MGSIVPSRVLGLLTLIDEGQMDNKIIVLAVSDPDADRITYIRLLRKMTSMKNV